ACADSAHAAPARPGTSRSPPQSEADASRLNLKDQRQLRNFLLRQPSVELLNELTPQIVRRIELRPKVTEFVLDAVRLPLALVPVPLVLRDRELVDALIPHRHRPTDDERRHPRSLRRDLRGCLQRLPLREPTISLPELLL